MKRAYVAKSFSDSALETIRIANGIIDEYEVKGLSLTLRQLYYQFVARALVPNNDREYKRLGDVVGDARMAGLVDWSAIEDRTRFLRTTPTWESPSEILSTCAESFHIDPWAGSAERVEVWVEKDALVGVVEAACDPLDVPYFSCRGYTSMTAIYEAAQRITRHLEAGRVVHVLHLGDHDPSGVDMSRDIEDRIKRLVTVDMEESGRFTSRDDVEDALCAGFDFERIALNRDQVTKYGPPPNPAKLTDSRANGYVKLHGYESWELDALEPTVLVKLIKDKVKQRIDPGSWYKAKKAEKAGRAILARAAETLAREESERKLAGKE